MFKSARWRSDKNKIRAVFKLQFYATQVSRLNVDGLTISVVSGETGKPTTRLEKAMVRDGCCRWENPVYETVKFVREQKSGKINQRIYHFLVQSASAKGGLIGETSIDFADYVETTKASSLSLPLNNSRSKAVLHVSIQRVVENAEQRNAEETEDGSFRSQDRSLKSQLSIDDTEESIANGAFEDGNVNKTSQNVGQNLKRGASCASDITISSTDSSSGLNTPRELAMRNTNLHQDPLNYQSSLNHAIVPHRPTVNASKSTYEENHRSQWEWLAGSDRGMSTDDSTHSSQDTFPGVRSENASDNEIDKLKAELVALARQVDVSELELQTLRKQVVKEGKRGQDLSREVVFLKEERDAFKAEIEKLKGFQKRMDDTKARDRLQLECGDPVAIVEEFRQELTYEKELNANLRLQLQKTQESNAELILAVQDLEEMLNEKEGKISDPNDKSDSKENVEKLMIADAEEDDDQKALEELVRGHRDPKEAYLLEQKILDLHSEIEIHKRDKDELEMQMEQLALDYEILKQENHDMSYKLEQSQLQDTLNMQCDCSAPYANVPELEKQIGSLETELKRQSKEFSYSLATIKELETHVKNLEEELEKQAQVFVSDLEFVTRAKVEQEQRAIRAEESLKLMKWKNVNTAERLQDEFRRLSVQMASTFDANEKLATKAMTEAGELRVQKSQLEEMLKKAHEELQSARDEYEEKIRELSSQVNLKANQIEQMLMEIDDKSNQLQRQRQHEEEAAAAFSQEINRLKDEIEKLTAERIPLSEQAEEKESISLELEEMKAALKETESLVQRLNDERNELANTIALLKKEAEKSLNELQGMTHLKEEKEMVVEFVQSELDSLKTQYNELKHSLSEDEAEKEKLRKQVFQLKADLKKKEDALTTVEKKLKETSVRAKLSDGAKPALRNNKAQAAPHTNKEVASLKEKIKLLEGGIKMKETALEASTNSFLEKENELQRKIEELETRMEELNQHNTKDTTEATTTSNGEVLAELASLKERNQSMEFELKEMQERYSEISLKFAEVEGERQQLVMTVRNLKNSRKI